MTLKLKKGFFRVTPSLSLPSGYTVFESSTPGVYSFTPQNSRLYKITMVGAGGGSAAFRLAGPGGMSFPAGLGGGSGGLSVYENVEMLQSQTYTIIVGAVGNSVDGGRIASDSGVIVRGGTGGTSSVSSIGSAFGGTGAVGNPSASQTPPSAVGAGGSGITTNGNDGSEMISDPADPNYHTAPGGQSVYNGYGEGGTGYFNSPYVSDGTNGYIKIETM